MAIQVQGATGTVAAVTAAGELKVEAGLVDRYGMEMTNVFGALSVQMDPVTVLQDPFDAGGIDTTHRWTSGGTVVPTSPAGGSLLVNPATAASASSSLVSQSAMPLSSTMVFGATVQLGTTATGNHRFWGWGTPPGTWTALDPVQDGIGFEVDTFGALRASVYASGIRVFTQLLTIPTDGAVHTFVASGRPGSMVFFMDDFSTPLNAVPVAVTPSVQTLPIRLHSINGLATTTGTPTMALSSAGTYDIGRNAAGISDGLYGWRKATVYPSGGLASAPVDGGKASYTASALGVSTTQTGDVFVLNGSATRTIRVTRVDVSCTTGAATASRINIIKRSTVGSGGTTAAATVAPNDSTSAAATATATGYTTAHTAGTLAANVGAAPLFTAAAGSGGGSWTFGDRPAQAVVLRGTTQQLAISNAVAIGTSGVWDFVVEFTEE